MALVARFLLHEHVSPLRWLGIALISGGVGFVAGGPALTAHSEDERPRSKSPRLAKNASQEALKATGVPTETEEDLPAASGGPR